MPHNVIFLGQTAAGLVDPELIQRGGFTVRPAAMRGDVHGLMNEQPGRIVLVDGHFNGIPAVGHAELRKALVAGWEIWGLGSMGAIRAYELQSFGMRGFGIVYGHFIAERDFQDDEAVAWHGVDASKPTHCEPLVHLRHALVAMERAGEIEHRNAQLVVEELKAMWFGHRTLERFVASIRRHAGEEAAAHAQRRSQTFDRYRVSAQDVLAFLSNEVWRQAMATPTPVPLPYGDSAVVSPPLPM